MAASAKRLNVARRIVRRVSVLVVPLGPLVSASGAMPNLRVKAQGTFPTTLLRYRVALPSVMRFAYALALLDVFSGLHKATARRYGRNDDPSLPESVPLAAGKGTRFR